jgi:hypothetical protein
MTLSSVPESNKVFGLYDDIEMRAYGEACAAAAVAAEREAMRSRPLYTNIATDAARYEWLREWLVKHGLLKALFCQPEAGMKAGDYWILRRPAVLDGDSCIGYGKSEEEAIDAAIRARSGA